MKKITLIIVFLVISFSSLSQVSDSTKKIIEKKAYALYNESVKDIEFSLYILNDSTSSISEKKVELASLDAWMHTTLTKEDINRAVKDANILAPMYIKVLITKTEAQVAKEIK